MTIRKLRPADIPAALALSTEAGWNQVAADWRRLLALAPEGCWGGYADGGLVATATAFPYGRALAWIGMVLVRMEYRRRGYGRAIFEHVLRQARAAGAAAVGLDATEAGRALYRQHGFTDVLPILRWSGRLRRTTSHAAAEALRREHLGGLRALDRRACGLDRSALLAQLLGEAEGTGFFCRGHEGAIRSYALLRPGRTAAHLGPLVATAPDDLPALLDAAAAHLDGTPVLLDVPEQKQAGRILTQNGLIAARRLTRMYCGTSEPMLLGSSLIAAAGLELG